MAGTLHEDLCTFMIMSRSVLLSVRNVSYRSCRANQNTHFMLRNFFSENGTVCENVEEHCRAKQAADGRIVRRMRVAYWLTKRRSVL